MWYLPNKMELTGNYIVRNPGCLLRSVSCDMTRTFGGITRGWMRAELDLNQWLPGLTSQAHSPAAND